jgi:hypothetical protein
MNCTSGFNISLPIFGDVNAVFFRSMITQIFLTSFICSLIITPRKNLTPIACACIYYGLIGLADIGAYDLDMIFFENINDYWHYIPCLTGILYMYLFGILIPMMKDKLIFNDMFLLGSWVSFYISPFFVFVWYLYQEINVNDCISVYHYRNYKLFTTILFQALINLYLFVVKTAFNEKDTNTIQKYKQWEKEIMENKEPVWTKLEKRFIEIASRFFFYSLVIPPLAYLMLLLMMNGEELKKWGPNLLNGINFITGLVILSLNMIVILMPLYLYFKYHGRPLRMFGF